MKAAGFTHGGFTITSPQGRAEAEASAKGVAEAIAMLVESLSDPRKDGWERFVRGYLSAEHRRERGPGARWARWRQTPPARGPRCRRASQKAVEGMAGALADHLARKPSRASGPAPAASVRCRC